LRVARTFIGARELKGLYEYAMLRLSFKLGREPVGLVFCSCNMLHDTAQLGPQEGKVRGKCRLGGKSPGVLFLVRELFPRGPTSGLRGKEGIWVSALVRSESLHKVKRAYPGGLSCGLWLGYLYPLKDVVHLV
jgi:hypothetical protein